MIVFLSISFYYTCTGTILGVDTVAGWSLRERLEKAVELMELLVYLDESPVGSLEYRDFKVHHFVIKDGRIKAIGKNTPPGTAASKLLVRRYGGNLLYL